MSGAPSISKRRAWWIATRPFSFPASIVPVLVGTAAAAGESFDLLLFALTMAGGVLIHIGTNLATDFFDFTDGVQPRATLSGVIQNGLISAKDVHRAAIAVFALGSICGLAIVALTGWPVLAAGLASVLAGYFYTAGPVSYGRRGLGEVVVFIFMGLVMVMATYWVQVERLSWLSFYAALPVAILVANILHANNLRDIDNDRARRKVTIATLTGRPVADIILWAFVLAAFGSIAVAVVLGGLPAPSLLVALSLPAAAATLRALRLRDSVALNALVRNTARLHLHFGVLLALGLLIDAIV